MLSAGVGIGGRFALRRFACTCTAGALLLSIWAGSASAATSIGQLDPGTPSGSCAGQSSWVQSAETGTPSYIVPAGQWVLVSWSHRSNSAAGRELAVRAWRATATVGTYTLVGAGLLRTLAPSGINTFYEQISVTGGDLLGLRVGNPPSGGDIIGGGASCAFSAATGNSVRYSVLTSEPAAGASAALPGLLTQYRLNVTSRLEPDADADGYGDETQDACPGSAGASSGCVPVAPGPGPDKIPPSATLSGSRDSIADGGVSVWVTASEAATATASGTVRIGSHARVHRLRRATKALKANSRARVTLRLSKKTRRAALRALRRGQRLRASISVLVQDAAGNSYVAKCRVALRR
jgi:hypothetical protein